jgi:hypothetical protein
MAKMKLLLGMLKKYTNSRKFYFVEEDLGENKDTSISAHWKILF